MRFLSDGVLDRLKGGMATPFGDPETLEEIPLQGTLVGNRFLIDTWLGAGGMSTVYRALDRLTGQPAVVKIVHPALVVQSKPGAALLVLKEVVALGRLNERVPRSPHVVRLLDTGVLQTTRHGEPFEIPWLAVELVEGGADGTTLAERVENCVRETRYAFPPRRAARAVMCLCEGVQAVHDVEVVHRDIKPANVLCTGAGDGEIWKLADFGIARPEGVAATFGGLVVGTPGFAPPELVALQAHEIGSWTDVFSLASVIYYLLAADQYFPGRSVRDNLRLVKDNRRRSLLDAPLASPELRRDEGACRAIDAALKRATALRPSERTRTAGELAEELLPALRSRLRRDWRAGSDAMPASPVPAWSLLQPEGEGDFLLDVAWEDGARFLAATTHGLVAWDERGFAEAPLPGARDLPPVLFLHRVGPGKWLAGGEGATLAVCTEQGVIELVRGPDASVVFVHASGDLEDILVVVGAREGHSALYALVGRHWLKPLPLADVRAVRAVARLDRTRWLVVGEDRSGAPYAAVYTPLAWELERVPAPGAAPLFAVASDEERGRAIAVGGDGTALIVEADLETPRVERVSRSGLTAVAWDGVRCWAAGEGKIFSRDASGAWTLIFDGEGTGFQFSSLAWSERRAFAATRAGGVLGSTS